MKLIKSISSLIYKPLTIIINQSLTTGIFPDELKIAKVLPLYKKDDDTNLNNYRPISLLPVPSKIFDKVVYLQVYEYFNTNKLFYICQHGFREKHSTETAILEFIDRIMNLLDNDEIPLSVFIDLSKAFDTLDHKILLHKLQFYGFDNISLLWFQNYLTNRQQYVQVDDFTSHLQPICTGVPQGSILGPLLFIIYVNDIHYASNIFKLTMYADDTTLLAPLSVLICNIKSDNICSDYLNRELDKIHNWFSVNKLSQNVTKTKYMIFHFPQRKIDSKSTVIMNNIEVKNVTEFNCLRVTSVIH